LKVRRNIKKDATPEEQARPTQQRGEREATVADMIQKLKNVIVLSWFPEFLGFSHIVDHLIKFHTWSYPNHGQVLDELRRN
jgi:hypothetical protein